MKRSSLSLFIALLTFPLLGNAQDEVEYQMELGGGLGGSFYFGDVNNKLYKNTGVAGQAVMRYLLNPRMDFKANLSYGKIKGSTADVSQYYPVDPNSGTVSPTPRSFSFNGGVADLSVVYEFNFLPYGFHGGYQGYSRISPFIQFGLGLTYADAGKAFTANIPLGFGVKYKLKERLNLAFDWSFHFSLSDKLDNLEAPFGISSTGFKNKDGYCLTMLTLTYDIMPKCIGCNKDE